MNATLVRKSSFLRRGVVAGLLLLLISLCASPAHAQARLVVRDSLGLPGNNLTCQLLGCNVVRGLERQLFTVSEQLHFVLLIPNFEISTAKARALLPARARRWRGSRSGRR